MAARLCWILLFAAGCATWPAQSGTGRHFDTAAKGPLRVVMFPSACAEQDGGCDDLDLGGIDARVKTELEFAGYTVVDGASLLADARTRDDFGADLQLLGLRVASAQTRRQTGSLFVDLPPETRRQVLKAAKADGIVRVQLQLSPRHRDYPFYGVRSLEGQARLGLGVDEAPAWAVRCSETWVTGVNFIGGPGQSYADGAAATAKCLAKQITDPASSR